MLNTMLVHEFISTKEKTRKKSHFPLNGVDRTGGIYCKAILEKIRVLHISYELRYH